MYIVVENISRGQTFENEASLTIMHVHPIFLVKGQEKTKEKSKNEQTFSADRQFCCELRLKVAS